MCRRRRPSPGETRCDRRECRASREEFRDGGERRPAEAGAFVNDREMSWPAEPGMGEVVVRRGPAAGPMDGRAAERWRIGRQSETAQLGFDDCAERGPDAANADYGDALGPDVLDESGARRCGTARDRARSRRSPRARKSRSRAGGRCCRSRGRSRGQKASAIPAWSSPISIWRSKPWASPMRRSTSAVERVGAARDRRSCDVTRVRRPNA